MGTTQHGGPGASGGVRPSHVGSERVASEAVMSPGPAFSDRKEVTPKTYRGSGRAGPGARSPGPQLVLDTEPGGS